MRNVIEYDEEGEPEYVGDRELEDDGEINAEYDMGSVIKHNGRAPLYTCNHCTHPNIHVHSLYRVYKLEVFRERNIL